MSSWTKSSLALLAFIVNHVSAAYTDAVVLPMNGSAQFGPDGPWQVSSV